MYGETKIHTMLTAGLLYLVGECIRCRGANGRGGGHGAAGVFGHHGGRRR